MIMNEVGRNQHALSPTSQRHPQVDNTPNLISVSWSFGSSQQEARSRSRLQRAPAVLEHQHEALTHVTAQLRERRSQLSPFSQVLLSRYLLCARLDQRIHGQHEELQAQWYGVPLLCLRLGTRACAWTAIQVQPPSLDLETCCKSYYTFGCSCDGAWTH